MKFIAPLTENEIKTLDQACRNHPQFRVRNRAHALLLNNKGFKIGELTAIFEVGRDAVSQWLSDWTKKGIVGLFDEPRSGRPTILSAAEQAQFESDLAENPHQLNEAASRSESRTGKLISAKTHKQYLKKRIWLAARATHVKDVT